MVTRPLQIERRSGKVRRSETDVRLLHHRTNQEVGESLEILLVVGEEQHVVADSATVAVILFETRSVMCYFGLCHWIFIIYFIFKLKVFAYVYKQ